MKLKPRKRVVVPAKVPAATPVPVPKTLDLEDVWDEATKLYANRFALRPSRSWSLSVSERSGANRVRTMRRKPAAKRLTHLLEGLSDRDMRVFHARAAINHEQAVAATRLTVLYNVSVPVGVLLVLNEAFPGFVGNYLTSAEAMPLVVAWGILILVAVQVLFATWYCFAGVHQSRDLLHIATLEMARRGLATTMGGDQGATLPIE